MVTSKYGRGSKRGCVAPPTTTCYHHLNVARGDLPDEAQNTTEVQPWRDKNTRDSNKATDVQNVPFVP